MISAFYGWRFWSYTYGKIQTNADNETNQQIEDQMQYSILPMQSNFVFLFFCFRPRSKKHKLSCPDPGYCAKPKFLLS